MSGARTFTGNLPQSWVAFWRNRYLRQCRMGGSILRPQARLTEQQQRQLRFGPCWDWWAVSPEQKALWWERDGEQSAA
jgi:hypothetical protein